MAIDGLAGGKTARTLANEAGAEPAIVVAPAKTSPSHPDDEAVTRRGKKGATAPRPPPAPLAPPPAIAQRFVVTEANERARIKALSEAVEARVGRLQASGIEPALGNATLGIAAHTTKAQTWSAIAAALFDIPQANVTLRHYQLLAETPSLATLLANGNDPTNVVAPAKTELAIESTLAGAELTQNLMHGQGVTLAHVRRELAAKAAAGDPAAGARLSELDALLRATGERLQNAEDSAAYARFTTTLSQAQRTVRSDTSRSRAALVEARRQLDALRERAKQSSAVAMLIGEHTVEAALLEAETFAGSNVAGTHPLARRKAREAAERTAALVLERGGSSLSELHRAGIIGDAALADLRTKLHAGKAQLDAVDAAIRDDQPARREALLRHLALTAGADTKALEEIFAGNARRDTSYAKLLASVETMPPDQTRSVLRSLMQIAVAGGDGGSREDARLALRLRDAIAPRTKLDAAVIAVESRAAEARNAALDGKLDDARRSLLKALALAQPHPALAEGLREQYAALQVRLAAGEGDYEARMPAAFEAQRARVDAEGPQARSSAAHRARLHVLEASAFIQAGNGREARATLEHLRGLAGEVPWVKERIATLLKAHERDDAGLRNALAELSSESMGEALAYQAGSAAVGAAAGASLGLWLGGVGAVPLAIVGAVVGSATGTGALKARNYHRASELGLFDPAVTAGLTARSASESGLTAAGLVFDGLAIAAPLRATAALGQIGVRALIKAEPLGGAALRVFDENTLKAVRLAHSRTLETSSTSERRALQAEVRNLLLADWTKRNLAFGGKPMAAAGLGLLVGPVAARVVDIEASGMTATEKSRAYAQLGEHLAQAALVMGVLGGSQALMTRFGANPRAVIEQLEHALPTDAKGQALAVGREDARRRGYVAQHTAIEGAGNLLRVEQELFVVGGKRQRVIARFKEGKEDVFVWRSETDPNATPTVMVRGAKKDFWYEPALDVDRVAMIGRRGFMRDASGALWVIEAGGLVRRVREAGQQPVSGAAAERRLVEDAPGLASIVDDRLVWRVRFDPNERYARDLVRSEVFLTELRTTQGTMWQAHDGFLVDGSGKVMRFVGTSARENVFVYADASGRSVGVRIDPQQNGDYDPLQPRRAVVLGGSEALEVPGFVPTMTGVWRSSSEMAHHGHAMTPEGVEYAHQIASGRVLRLDDVPERDPMAHVDVAALENEAKTSPAVADLLENIYAKRNPNPGLWFDANGRQHFTVRESGTAYAFDPSGEPVGRLVPGPDGALTLRALDAGDQVRGIGPNAGYDFLVHDGARMRVLAQSRGAAVVAGADGRVLFARQTGRGWSFANDGVLRQRGRVTHVVVNGAAYKNVEDGQGYVLLSRVGSAESGPGLHVARIERNSQRVVLDPPDLAARRSRTDQSRIYHGGTEYEVAFEPESRESLLKRLASSLEQPHGSAERDVAQAVKNLILRADDGEMARVRTALVDEVRVGHGPLLERLRALLQGADPIRALEQLAHYSDSTRLPFIIARRSIRNEGSSDPHDYAFFVRDGERLRPATIDELGLDFDRRVGKRVLGLTDLPMASKVELGPRRPNGSRDVRVHDGGQSFVISIGLRGKLSSKKLPTDEQIQRWLSRTPLQALRETRSVEFRATQEGIQARFDAAEGRVTYHESNDWSDGQRTTWHEIAGHGMERWDPNVHALLLQARFLDLHRGGARHGTARAYGDHNLMELAAVAVEEWFAGNPQLTGQPYLHRALSSLFEAPGTGR